MTDKAQPPSPADTLELQRRLASVQAHAEHNDAVVAELKRSEELTRRLIEAMPGGVVHVSIDGSIQLANAEAQRVLGLGFDELTQKYVADFVTETLFEDGTACPVEAYPVSRALATGKAQPPCTIGVRRPDGETSWADFTAVPVRGEDGTTTGAVVTFIDITRRKKLETNLRASQKMEAIGRLAGGVAHDFNNLLTAIVGNTTATWGALAADDARREDLEHVLAACDHASALTRRLLALSRRQPIAPRVCVLGDLVEETASILRRMIGESIELVLDLAPDAWPVTLDRSDFEQVLINLAINARDAMPNGGTLQMTVANAGDSEVALRVRDTGVGMAPGTVERMFEPFFSTKGPGGGTGLGLATCYGVVERVNGRIWAQSRLGEGTTVEVRLPRAERGLDVEPAPAPAPEETAPGNETIMLVEDQELVRRVVRRCLERGGYRVIAVATGSEAIAHFEGGDSEVALLLTDVVMPTMSGPEVAAAVVELCPTVSLIFMSGYEDDVLRHNDCVVDAPLLAKPFEPPTLLRLVREQLDLRAARLAKRG